jgi:hypothetical protein
MPCVPPNRCTAGWQYNNYYSYSYAKYGAAYKESVVSGSSTYFQPGSTTTRYDGNGNIYDVNDTFNGSAYRSFITDQSGRILQKTQGGQNEYYFYADDKPLGATGAAGAADFDLALATRADSAELKSETIALPSRLATRRHPHGARASHSALGGEALEAVHGREDRDPPIVLLPEFGGELRAPKNAGKLGEKRLRDEELDRAVTCGLDQPIGGAAPQEGGCDDVGVKNDAHGLREARRALLLVRIRVPPR